MRYRADIDGLRGIAILPVVFFHAHVWPFTGGFVGVDVFFVISGFLITGIIVGEIDAGRFSLAHFYERRVRRLFPALFTVMLFCFVPAYLLLMPDELADFGLSVVATTLFVSNILFYRQAGYFTAPAEQKPLLHTWSLAVEEQFYILFPLFLLLVARLLGRRWIPALLPAAIGSLALSAWTVTIARDATFFLAPTRAWELMLGALLAVGAVPETRSRWLREAAALTGLGLIAYSAVGFGEDTLFPGPSALLPCVGTAMLIRTGGATLVGRLLATGPVVFTGLISYSLYLWHWPLLVFARSAAVRDLTGLETGVVIAASVVVAALSWRLIELPFRGRRPLLGRESLFGAAAAAMSASIVLGAAGHLDGGWPGRLPAEVLAYASATLDRNPDEPDCLGIPPAQVASGSLCGLGPEADVPAFAVWGDSHADALQPALAAVADEHGLPGWFASYPGCPPLLGHHDPNIRGCRPFNEAMLAVITDRGITSVLLIARWSHYEPELVARLMPDTVAALVERGVRVGIVRQVPELPHTGPNSMARLALLHGSAEALIGTRAAHLRQQRPYDEVFDRLAGSHGALLIDPAEILCDDARCRSLEDGRPLYRDNNHLGTFGALHVRGIFVPALEAMVSDG
jgi:peptidoglycan/LPS O-acetylase OafA/YrhL